MLAVNIKREELQKGVSQTASIAEKNSTIPVLSNILLVAHNNELILSATDTEITFRGAYPAEILEEGSLTIPAKTLNELIRSINSELVELRQNENMELHLESGLFKTDIFTVAAEEFPKMPDTGNINYADFVNSELIDAIDKTIFSVAQDEKRFNLSGVYWKKEEIDDRQYLRLVSSDTHRLNLATLLSPSLANLELERGIIVAKKGLLELRKMAELNEVIQIGAAIGHLVAKTDNSILLIRLLEGGFPDFNQVIPKGNDKKAYLIRRDLIDLLRRINVMQTDKYQVSNFSLSNSSLHVFSSNPLLGQAEDFMTIEYDGPKITTGFTTRYMIEVLSAMKSERICLNFFNESIPYILTGPEDPGFIGVLMPMRS